MDCRVHNHSIFITREAAKHVLHSKSKDANDPNKPKSTTKIEGAYNILIVKCLHHYA